MYSSWQKRHLTQSRLLTARLSTTTQLVTRTWLLCISMLEDIVTLPCEDSMLLSWELCKKISISLSTFPLHERKSITSSRLWREILCRWINCPGLIHARLTRAYPPVVWKQRRYANFCRWMSAWQDLARHHHGDQASSLCPRVSKGRNLNNNPGALCFLCLRRLPVYSRRAMWKTAGYSMLPFKIFIEIYQIMYKHRIKIYRNIYQKDHCKAVVKLRRQTWQASDSQRYSKRQCRQCIQFRQCRLQSQELRKTCIISCENWSAAKQSHLLGSHFAFHYPVLTFSWFLSQSNTSWIVLEWSWKGVLKSEHTLWWRRHLLKSTSRCLAWNRSHGYLETTLSILSLSVVPRMVNCSRFSMPWFVPSGWLEVGYEFGW